MKTSKTREIWSNAPSPIGRIRSRGRARIPSSRLKAVLCPLPQIWNSSYHWDLPTGPGQVTTVLGPSCLMAPIYLRVALLRASHEIMTVKCHANRQAIFKYKEWTAFQLWTRQTFLISQRSSPSWINIVGNLASKVCFLVLFRVLKFPRNLVIDWVLYDRS